MAVAAIPTQQEAIPSQQGFLPVGAAEQLESVCGKMELLYRKFADIRLRLELLGHSGPEVADLLAAK